MREELAGKIFGRLKVLREFEEKLKTNRKRYWSCQCECGNHTVVEEGHLKSGHTKSCGCYRKDVLRKRKKVTDIGQRFGRLTVLEEVENNGEKGTYLKCLCDCGAVVIRKRENLMLGNTRSCGCLRHETRKINMKNAIHFVEGTCIERISNRTESKSNTSGHRGVYYRGNGRWRASIGFQGKNYNLGTYGNYEEAVQARVEAEKKLYDSFLERYYEQLRTEEGLCES